MSSLTADNCVTLRVDVPICAFRPHESREYQDTHPVPPLSAVYGMLLSLCGVPRQDKDQHEGVRMALAIERLPERAKVFRKFRRGKELVDLRPDYQDLLIGVKLWVWVETGTDRGTPPLVEKIVTALKHPEQLERFGGLSLGESSYLVDSISLRRPDDSETFQFLKPAAAGFYNLPIWIDHTRNHNLRRRFNIESIAVKDALEDSWVDIVSVDRDAHSRLDSQ